MQQVYSCYVLVYTSLRGGGGLWVANRVRWGPASLEPRPSSPRFYHVALEKKSKAVR